MIQNKNEYDIVKERQSKDIFCVTYKKKKVSCDICKGTHKRQDVQLIKYPIIHETMGRLIMSKKVCKDCIDEVMDILNNLKYK